MVGLSIQEGIRRRVFLAVLVLTAGFLALYALGAHFAFRDVDEFAAGEPKILDAHAFTGATIFGLAMFATLFLGAVLAVFLTLGVVRGDAESGLLQPIVVRPIGRTTMLLARFAGAAALSAAYVVVVYLAACAITKATGDWSPDHLLGPALGLALGGGDHRRALAARLDRPLGHRAGHRRLHGLRRRPHRRPAGADRQRDQLRLAAHDRPGRELGAALRGPLPAGLHGLISGTSGLTGVVLQLGPFGGSEAAGPGLILWAFAYLLGVLALAAFVFSRRDL